MDDLSLDMLKHRLDRLERENLLFRVVGITMIVVFGVAACEVAQDFKEEIRAKNFVVVGDNNEQIGSLNSLGLTLRGRGANIILRNVDETDWPRSIPSDNPRQFQPYISLSGSNGSIRLDVDMSYGPALSIESVTDGKPSLHLYKDAKVIWQVP